MALGRSQPTPPPDNQYVFLGYWRVPDETSMQMRKTASSTDNKLVFKSHIEIGTAVEKPFESASSKQKAFNIVAKSIRRHILHVRCVRRPNILTAPYHSFISSYLHFYYVTIYDQFCC